MGRCIRRLVPPPAPPQRAGRRDLPSPGRHLRAGTPAKPVSLVTINTVLASAGRGLDQSAA